MNKFVRNLFSKGTLVASSVLAFSVSGLAMADGTDPTSTITTQLATYATDVGTICAAVLLIVYGKKLVSYLRPGS